MGDIYLRWAFVWQCLGPFLPTEGQITYIQYKCVLTKASVTETNLMGFGSRIFRLSTGHKDSLIVWWAWKSCKSYMLPEFNWTITIWDFLEPSSLNHWMICFVCGFFFCLFVFSPFACLPCLQHSICYCAMNSKMPWNCSGSTHLPFSSIVGEKVKLHIHLQSLKIQIKGFFVCFVFSRFKSRLRTWKFWLLTFHECIITGIYLANTVYDVLFLTL